MTRIPFKLAFCEDCGDFRPFERLTDGVRQGAIGRCLKCRWYLYIADWRV